MYNHLFLVKGDASSVEQQPHAPSPRSALTLRHVRPMGCLAKDPSQHSHGTLVRCINDFPILCCLRMIPK